MAVNETKSEFTWSFDSVSTALYVPCEFAMIWWRRVMSFPKEKFELRSLEWAQTKSIVFIEGPNGMELDMRYKIRLTDEFNGHQLTSLRTVLVESEGETKHFWGFPENQDKLWQIVECSSWELLVANKLEESVNKEVKVQAMKCLKEQIDNAAMFHHPWQVMIEITP